MPGHPRASAARGMTAASIGVGAWAIGPALAKGVDLDGLATAFHRSWLGAGFVIIALYLSGGRLSFRAIRLSTAGGTLLGLEMALFFSAIKLTTVANTTVIAALQPLIIMVVVEPVFGERVRATQVLSTVAAIGGVTLVAIGSASGGSWSLRGDALACAAVFAWAGYFVASKAARRHLATLEYQAALLVIASLVLLPIVVLSGQGLATNDVNTLTGLVVLAAIPTVGHLLINWAHAHLRLLVLSLMTLALPVISTILAAAFLDEPIVSLQVVGIAVALGSIGVALSLDMSSPGTVPPARPRHEQDEGD